MGFGSMSHWIIILLVIVILFGGKKIPELAKGIGKGIKSFKKEMADETDVKTTEQLANDEKEKIEKAQIKSEQKTEC